MDGKAIGLGEFEKKGEYEYAATLNFHHG